MATNVVTGGIPESRSVVKSCFDGWTPDKRTADNINTQLDIFKNQGIIKSYTQHPTEGMAVGQRRWTVLYANGFRELVEYFDVK